MILHNALGHAGGAGGIDEIERVARVEFKRGVGNVLRLTPVVKTQPRRVITIERDAAVLGQVVVAGARRIRLGA